MKVVSKAFVVAGAWLGLALSNQTSHAETFDWSLTSTGSPVIGSGTLTATQGAGGWVVDSISGSFTDVYINFAPFTVSGVAQPSENISGVTNDNLIIPAGPTFLDANGLGFQTSDGAFDIFSSNGTYEVDASGLGIGTGDFVLTAVAAVPEPSTWAMMILGFVGVGFMAYRRKNWMTANAA